MIYEKYTVSGLDEMCYYLTQLKDKTDWKLDFYNIYGVLLLSFDSDEETLERLKEDSTTYEMVTEWMDVALMMGKEY